ncbi:MAG TPA: outer membrane lipoprotein chaperone LolA [Bryobacteraceae bacterium]|jgi:outer membrane lipoprotein carrier protein
MKKLSLVLLAATLLPAQDVDTVLKGVENRYNNINTLQVDFSYTLAKGLRRSVQKGVLYLHKPGRMRWQYSTPEGNLFISDGKYVYDYDAKANEMWKQKLNDAGDLRGALGFLLGKINFDADFKQFESDSKTGLIKAIPKSDKAPYTEISFLATPDFVIHRLIVKGVDGSTSDYTFENEKKNPPVPDTMFHFTPPPGVKLVDEATGN